MPQLPPCCNRLSVKALIRNSDGQILLAREIDDKWGFLGGGVDHGEDIIDALEREFKEETGLEIQVNSQTPELITTFENYKGINVINVFYDCGVVNIFDFISNDECLEVKYFDLSEIPRLNLANEVKAFLKNYGRA